MRHFVPAFALASMMLVGGAGSASADPSPVPTTYTTVDSIETSGNSYITITGIRGLDQAATTIVYRIAQGSQPQDAAARCDRFALLAMSKPGKYIFEVTDLYKNSNFTCKLSVKKP